MEQVDLTIIGAGVVGLAVGAELAKKFKDIVILEKNPSFGQETSSRNSEVIHSGVHYKPGSLKAKLCVEGNSYLYDICKKNNIGFKNLQKLTVALTDSEIDYLFKLKKQGEINGVKGLKILNEAETRNLEPSIKAKASLLTPSTGIIDSHKLMEYFLYKFKDEGGLISYDSEVAGIEKLSEGYKIIQKKDNFSFITQRIINCAGLFSDKVASIAGIDIEKAGYRLKYLKGEYFKINSRMKVNHLVYGVPPDSQSLGIHIVIDLAGGLKLGPNAFLVDSLNYDVDISHQKEFISQAKDYFIDFDDNSLTPDMAGIRPKLASKTEDQDFIIKEESEKGYPGLFNLIGIESPGLTSSPAIAKYVTSLIK